MPYKERSTKSWSGSTSALSSVGGSIALYPNMGFNLRLVFRGSEFQVSLGEEDPSLQVIGDAISRRTGMPYETLKLLGGGRKGPPLQPVHVGESTASDSGKAIYSLGIPRQEVSAEHAG